ncbi:hypothetical protein SAMN05444344_2297 [Tenacibaculum mesophilum]|uniref:Uncharacterized protein n=1 Tax=Tenacibaculum mesophilum TaxID=104268 RepID=A0ABN5T393_9FLAO|nr:hypothetical protein [Tenacibaculum mesophilum]AZJ31568.1 hypothetical protein D6200_02885 [Tenacibaculum mesophilum]QFS29616.1 hypothetical protein F9Y86_14875 [Tenacibaculum mesophilum]SHG00168.1 hypothetical protein SAMN05444344_2297 [Tenacibaculum mesophilum]
MKRIFIVIILLIPVLTFAQNKVELRDLTFFISTEFKYFTEQDRKLDYKNFHEVGKIYTDSTDLEKFPKIQYQYYEIPEFGLESSKKVLISLNQVMTKDINADTLIIKESENYSLAKYSIMGKSLFEMKSLGKKGWVNIQYFDLPNNDSKSFKTAKEIISSIKHKQKYESENDSHMKESEELSKRALIFLSIGLLLFLTPKLIKK